MAIKHNIRTVEIGRSLAGELAQLGGVVQGLWWTAHRGVLTFWVLTKPIDTETQQHIYERTAVLYELFPSVEFAVHVLNPEWDEDGDALSALPDHAQPIPLPAA
jgi:hypothetical protein